ncbi:MAG: asparagine synthase (glutamine-hydrolyzing) [Acidobacteriota bacterium]|nr:asparagine synthase (glutamine-hydrolyzing) [Acidobacteriota bacterium]
MCGIAGFIAPKPSTLSPAVLEAMTAAIRHRGPDDAGFYRDPWASLGHRRLSIVDVSAGHQPMFNEARNLSIVYNGEIYNHADLRPALERAGHVYTTRCDTETILHAFEQYGPDCLTHFRGMFAFAIWDKNTRSLFCARDRLGVKPLYYYHDANLFAFASEIKALLEHPGISPRVEESLLPEYLTFGHVTDERTLFAGIRTLLPGHFLRIRCPVSGARFEPEIHKYWDLPTETEPESRSDSEWIAGCRAHLEESVRLRLMSDVPLGMFLSGGLDSSAIAALMQQMVSEPVKTFAVGYRETQYSELGFARTVAQQIGTDHREVTIGRQEFFDALPRLIWHEDEPAAWPSSVSLHAVSALASKHVKVVLTGEGSDELFGGYGRYNFQLSNHRWMRRYRHVPGPIRQAILGAIANSTLLGAGLRRKLKHTFLGRTEDLPSLYLDNFYGAFSAEEQAALLSHVLPGSPYTTFLHYWNAASDLSPLDRMLFADKKTYLIKLLMKQDKMSMAASIESRVPFLDHPFVEFASRVPAHLKIRNGVAKYILKEAVADLLPRDIVHRKKMGFPTPVKTWLLDPASNHLYDFLLEKDGLLASYFDLNAVKSLLVRHRSGVEDATDRIWNLLNLQYWGDLFITGKREHLKADPPVPASV